VQYGARPGLEARGQPFGERRAHVLPSPVHLADGFYQLLRGVVFGEIPGRAGAKGADRPLVLRVHAEHQDFDRGMLLPHHLQHLDEAGPRHRDVEQDHVGRRFRDPLQYLAGRGRLSHHRDAGVVGGNSPKACAHDGMIIRDQ